MVKTYWQKIALADGTDASPALHRASKIIVIITYFIVRDDRVVRMCNVHASSSSSLFLHLSVCLCLSIRSAPILGAK